MLYELRRAFPRHLSKEYLASVLPTRDHAIDRDPEQIPTLIVWLRADLVGTRYAIVTIHGFGYRLALAHG